MPSAINFDLHPNLSKKPKIIDLNLCTVLLQDESNYLWIFLVPRRAKVSKIMDLERMDQIQLYHELDLAQKVVWEMAKPTQLNVAAIGNKIPQLHLHIIARNEDDPAWPNTVWDHPMRAPYEPEKKKDLIDLLHAAFYALR